VTDVSKPLTPLTDSLVDEAIDAAFVLGVLAVEEFQAGRGVFLSAGTRAGDERPVRLEYAMAGGRDWRVLEEDRIVGSPLFWSVSCGRRR
jgi:hypothetical protein